MEQEITLDDFIVLIRSTLKALKSNLDHICSDELSLLDLIAAEDDFSEIFQIY